MNEVQIKKWLNSKDVIVYEPREEAVLIETIKMFINDHSKQLPLSDMNESLTVGKKVVVTDCIYGHEFEIGQEVEIIYNDVTQKTNYLCDNGKSSWWLSSEELTVR
jgi:hypothetical protein